MSLRAFLFDRLILRQLMKSLLRIPLIFLIFYLWGRIGQFFSYRILLRLIRSLFLFYCGCYFSNHVLRSNGWSCLSLSGCHHLRGLLGDLLVHVLQVRGRRLHELCDLLLLILQQRRSLTILLLLLD